MSKRTKNVVMTNEAKVLRRFREKAGLSIRQAGEAMGVSSSLVSQVENGRENIPKGERLQRYLDCYEVGLSTFKKHVQDFQEEQTDSDIIISLLSKLGNKDIKSIRFMAEHFARTK